MERAYAECRAIAKREAKNFYYSFVALPEPRRNAICAIYAFMRKADDLSDDESISARRAPRAGWMRGSRTGTRLPAGRRPTNPVFVRGARRDARFNIPLQLLDELVAGTTMDLEHAGGRSRIPTPPSTICIATAISSPRWWAWSAFASSGTRIPRAEKLAEETGIAFQLTNILRDVAEDAERKRVYLPLDELRRARCLARFAADIARRVRRPLQTSARCWPRSARARSIITNPRGNCCR